jgi:hypothetical protein
MRVRKGQQSIKLDAYQLEKVIVNESFGGMLLARVSIVSLCINACKPAPRYYSFDGRKIRFCCPFHRSKEVSLYYTEMKIK